MNNILIILHSYNKRELTTFNHCRHDDKNSKITNGWMTASNVIYVIIKTAVCDNSDNAAVAECGGSNMASVVTKQCGQGG